jgi:RNA polymerase sigma-70 factor (ECF subfamily)
MPDDPSADQDSAPPPAAGAEGARAGGSNLDSAIVAQIPHLQRYALSLTRRADLAEDLVQESLTRALSRRHLFRGDRHMRPWLFAIMHNLHVNRRRRAQVQFDVLAASAASAVTDRAPPNQEQIVELAWIAQALQALPDEQKHVILLIVVDDLSYKEAAEVLGIPVGTVMSRLARGRERLRHIVEGRRHGGAAAQS